MYIENPGLKTVHKPIEGTLKNTLCTLYTVQCTVFNYFMFPVSRRSRASGKGSAGTTETDVNGTKVPERNNTIVPEASGTVEEQQRTVPENTEVENAPAGRTGSTRSRTEHDHSVERTNGTRSTTGPSPASSPVEEVKKASSRSSNRTRVVASLGEVDNMSDDKDQYQCQDQDQDQGSSKGSGKRKQLSEPLPAKRPRATDPRPEDGESQRKKARSTIARGRIVITEHPEIGDSHFVQLEEGGSQ